MQHPLPPRPYATRFQPLAHLGNPGTYPQAGLYAAVTNRYRLATNRFANLAAGLHLRLAAGSGTAGEVSNTEFVDCAAGLALRDNRLGTAPASPISIWPRCNTFSRSSTTPGDSYGIYVAENASVRFEGPANAYPSTSTTTPDVMKNLFTGAATGGTFTHIWNEDANPVVSYTTFAPNPANPSIPSTNSGNLVLYNVTNANGPVFNLGINDCESEDGITDHGIQSRSGTGGRSPKVALAAPVPNPANAQISLSYALPPVCASVEILLRESWQGSVVRRTTLRTDQTEASLAVGDLRPATGIILGYVSGRWAASSFTTVAD